MTDQGAESRPVPFITVIVPTLDSAGTIVACLQSLASQTYPDFEVPIQDGLSADATVAIVEAFVEAHPQFDIHVHREGAAASTIR